MKNISIFGTSSDAGKSTVTFIIAKLLQNLGYKTAPFKAQNVSNNSKVTKGGGELAIAQYFQAEVLGIEPNNDMNPVLLKSGHGNNASLILQGKPSSQKDVRRYYKELDGLKPLVDESFKRLNSTFDIVVCEGAGSPVELNLMDKDLSNIYIADTFDTKIILVADIEKGGVFASIYGTLALLPQKLRENVIGVLVNKFRGDKSLFDEGIKIIENDFDVPVLGVLPYLPFNLGFEDSQSLLNYEQSSDYKITVGVVRFPHISNYNDFEPLILDEEVKVDFIQNGIENYDAIILPGTKKTIEDLIWLKKCGLFEKIKEYKKPILGICGGYQMMFENILDIDGIEHDPNTKISGLGFVKSDVAFTKEKTLKRSRYKQFGFTVSGFTGNLGKPTALAGFEIRHGKVKEGFEFFEEKNRSGSFIHGLLDNDNFRTAFLKKLNKKYKGYEFKKLKKEMIDSFIDEMSQHIDMKKIQKAICDS